MTKIITVPDHVPGRIINFEESTLCLVRVFVNDSFFAVVKKADMLKMLRGEYPDTLRYIENWGMMDLFRLGVKQLGKQKEVEK